MLKKKFIPWTDSYKGCAAFHPTDDNIVFMFGGKNGNGYKMKHAFKYHIDDQTHHDLKELEYEFSNLGCMGFVKKDERPVSNFRIQSPTYTYLIH